MFPWLKNINKPCLVMTGQNDQGCCRDHNKKMYKGLEKSKLVILPKVKHSILIEEPSKTVKNILNFISNI